MTLSTIKSTTAASEDSLQSRIPSKVRKLSMRKMPIFEDRVFRSLLQQASEQLRTRFQADSSPNATEYGPTSLLERRLNLKQGSIRRLLDRSTLTSSNRL